MIDSLSMYLFHDWLVYTMFYEMIGLFTHVLCHDLFCCSFTVSIATSTDYCLQRKCSWRLSVGERTPVWLSPCHEDQGSSHHSGGNSHRVVVEPGDYLSSFDLENQFNHVRLAQEFKKYFGFALSTEEFNQLTIPSMA
jgi:hypothetical protein